MKLKALLIGASILALTPAAHAADWNGLYAGLNAGFANGTVDWSGQYYATPGSGSPAGSPATGSFDMSGTTLGVTAGANMDMGGFVLGVEGDIDWADISGTGDPIDTGPDATVPSSQLDWIATLRGRLGVAVTDNILLYGTAGWATAGGTLSLTNLDGPGDDRTADITASGWTAGVGAEIAVSDNVSFKAEYLFSKLTMDDVDFGDVLPADHLTTSSTLDNSMFRIGVNYKF